MPHRKPPFLSQRFFLSFLYPSLSSHPSIKIHEPAKRIISLISLESSEFEAYSKKPIIEINRANVELIQEY